MFANLIEDLNDGTIDHDYDLRSIGDQKSVRFDAAATLDKPSTLTISHVKTGTGDKEYRNTLARIDSVVERASDEIQGTVSVYLVIRTPTKVTDAAGTKKVVLQLQDFLDDVGAVDKLINGEI